MRPSAWICLFFMCVLLFDGAMYLSYGLKCAAFEKQQPLYDTIVSGLGLTDLCVATEARYTRHPAVSDAVVPFMDYPASLEHFPTGTFWAAGSASFH